MIRRLLTSLIVLAFAAVPAFSPGVAAQVGEGSFDVQFSCFKDGSAQLTGENHYPDKSISMTVLTDTGSGNFEDLGAIILGPGQSQTLDIGPGARVGGWNILVESLEPGEGTLFTVPYPRDCFPFSDPEPGPSPMPTMPAPTATTVPVPTETVVPAVNTFDLLSSDRMCADQSFHASWSGSNLAGLEFSLTNTSDEWTSGWLVADPATSSFTAEIDHHGYDKIMAEATFEDGTSETVSVNVGACTESPAPPPPSTGGTTSASVTSLPSTGAGSSANALIALSALMLTAVTLIVAGTVRKRS